MKNTFLVDSIEIAPSIFIDFLLDKEMNYRELIEGDIQIRIELENVTYLKRSKRLRYVYEDRIIDFDRLMNFIKSLLKEITEVIEAIDSGFPLTFMGQPLSNVHIEIRKEVKKSIENLTEYKLQPYIIKLYTLLTSFKGSDTLQKRKYKEMIKHQEEAMDNWGRDL